MKKVLMLAVVALLLALPAFSFADSGINEFLKGNDPDDLLLTYLYVAKTFKDVQAPIVGKTNVRIKFERGTEIDNWSHGQYGLSAGLEF